MNLAGNLALVSVINVDITRGSDEQLVHGAVDEFAADDMPKGMNRSSQLDGDDKVNGLKQPFVEWEP